MHKQILLFTYGLVPFTLFNFMLSYFTEMISMISSSVWHKILLFQGYLPLALVYMSNFIVS